MADLRRSVGVVLLTSTLGIAAGLPPAYGNTPGGSGGLVGGRHGDRHGGQWGKGGPLGLSKEQRRKMQDAFKSERAAIKPLRRALRDSAIKLKDQVEDKASDADVQASIDGVTKARQALQAERRQFRAKIDAILTPTQRARALLFRMHRRAGMRGGELAWRRGCPAKHGMMRRHGGGRTSMRLGPSGDGAASDRDASAPGSEASSAAGQ